MGRRLHDDPAARKPLAQVIVGVAHELQRDAVGEKGPEALPRRAVEGDFDGSLGQALAAPALDDAIAEDRAHRAVNVADRHDQPAEFFAFDARLDLLQNLPVEMVPVNVALPPHAAQRATVGAVGRGENGGKIQPLRLPVLDGLAAAQPIDAADHVVELAEAQLGHPAAGLFGHEGQKSHHVLRLARKPLPQLRILRGDAHRAGAQMAFAHQQAAERNQGRGAEAEPLGPEQGGDHHVAAGLHLPVGLHHDAIAEAVEHQRLLGFGQAEFPGRAGVLDRAQGAGAGAAVVAADEHLVGVALGHARGHRAHAHFGDQLDRHHHARGWRTSGRRSTGPGLRWNRCRGAAAAR